MRAGAGGGMSLMQRGQQRRLDARLRELNNATSGQGGLEKWQRIETDALTIPSESACETDAMIL